MEPVVTQPIRASITVRDMDVVLEDVALARGTTKILGGTRPIPVTPSAMPVVVGAGVTTMSDMLIGTSDMIAADLPTPMADVDLVVGVVIDRPPFPAAHPLPFRLHPRVAVPRQTAVGTCPAVLT